MEEQIKKKKGIFILSSKCWVFAKCNAESRSPGEKDHTGVVFSSDGVLAGCPSFPLLVAIVSVSTGRLENSSLRLVFTLFIKVLS